jgi:hypothetical protein
MTALTSLAAKVSAIKECVCSFTTDLPKAYESEVHTVFKKLRDHTSLLETQLYPEVIKLEAKKNAKDPISGVSRYGPKQVEKIDVLVQEITNLKVQCQELMVIYQAYCNTYPPPDANKQSVTETLIPIATPVFISDQDEKERRTATLQFDAEANRQADEYRRKRAEEAEVQNTRHSQVSRLYEIDFFIFFK